MAKKKLKMNLPTVDDLFSSQTEVDNHNANKIINIPCSQIDHFENHPFQVKEDRHFELLLESIKEYGLLEAIHVREKENGRYEVFNGHRRKYAHEKLGIENISAIVHNINYDKAVLLMAHANLTNREQILVSERVFTYKMIFESLERQGFRSDLGTSPGIQAKLRTRDIIAQNISIEGKKITGSVVEQYIKLTNLIPEILELVDNGKMGFTPAYHIAFIEDKGFQKLFYDVVIELDKYPSIAQAKFLREKYNNYDEKTVFQVISEEKGNQKEYGKVSLSVINKHFSSELKQDQID